MYYDQYDELFVVGGPQGRFLIEEVDGEVEITNQLDRVVENALIHELSHQITKNTALDHYHSRGIPKGEKCNNYPICSECGEDQARDSFCLMAKSQDMKVDEEVKHCDDCFEDLLYYLEEHYIA